MTEGELFLITFAESQPLPPPARDDEDEAPFARTLGRSRKEGPCPVEARPTPIQLPGISPLRGELRSLRRVGDGPTRRAHLRAYGDGLATTPATVLSFATHHRAFDKRLFAVDPSTLELAHRDGAPGSEELGITKPSIAHLRYCAPPSSAAREGAGVVLVEVSARRLS